MSVSRSRPSTLVDLVHTAVAGHGDSGLLLAHREGRWQWLSGRQVFAAVCRLAAALAGRGLGPGDRVALLSWNRTDWMIADLAIMSSGMVTVPLYPNLPSAQVADILVSSGARAVITEDAGQFEKVERALAGGPGIDPVVVIDRWGLPDEVLSLADLEQEGETVLRREPDIWERRAAEVDPERLATLIFTSGTTGVPKGVKLTHGNLCANVAASLRRLSLNDQDLALSFLPLAHVFERTVGLIYLAAGTRIAYARSLDHVAEDLLEVCPTVFATVPRVLEKIRTRIETVIARMPRPLQGLSRWAMEAGRARADRHLDGQEPGFWRGARARLADAIVLRRIREQLGGRLRAVISGGAGLPVEVGRFFWGIGVPIIEGYGLTETSPVIAVNSLDACRLGTVGPPLDNVELRLAPDGEILVRGPSISDGYWEDPEATRDAFRDGWFATGDLGALDQRGYLRVTGRKKEILVTSAGKNVAPMKVEALLQESPLIERAVVVGDGRPYLVALLVLADGAAERIAADEGMEDLEGRPLLDHPAVVERVRAELDRLQAELASYETVKRFHLLERDLTIQDGLLTPTLKVRRGEVDRIFAEPIGALYA